MPKILRKPLPAIVVLQALTLLGTISVLRAQSPVPPPLPQNGENRPAEPNTLLPNNGNSPHIVYEPAKPVIINGKPASELTEREMHEFLQNKIKVISQEDGEVKELFVAPGYVLTITYEEPPVDGFIGDGQLATYKVVGKTMVINARERAGDTNFKVLFSGGVLREYHIFITPTFAKADSTYRVLAAQSGSLTADGGQATSFMTKGGQINIANVNRVIKNYDALVQEHALDAARVRRSDVWRRSPDGAFLYFYDIDFPNRSEAIQFNFRNRTQAAIDPSRIRLQIGDIRYTPDYISAQKTAVAPGAAVDGFVFFKDPPFSLDQPFELVLN